MTLTPIEKRAPQTKVEGKKTDKGFSVSRGKGNKAKGKLLPKNTNHHLKEIQAAFGKNADPYFNHQAAMKAAELVMKMDDDTARVFTHLVVSDLLDADIEKNQRTLQRHVDEIIAKRIDRIKKAMLSTVSKGDSSREEALAYAEALSVIEKAVNPYTSGSYKFEETDFRRDPSTGRFMTKVNVSDKASPMHHKDAETIGIPGSAAIRDPKTRAQYQQEYQQLANFLAAVHMSTDTPGHQNIYLHLKDKRTGQNYTVENKTGTKPDKDAWDPTTERLVGIEALPSNINVGGASFALANSLGASTHTGTKIGHGMNQVDSHLGQFSQGWDESLPQEKYQSNARLYSRVKHGSQFVGQIAPYGSKAQIAAQFGEFVGTHGAEAEKVIGPTARKSGYRYRGTEKTPDKTLMGQYERAVRRENRDAMQFTPEQNTRVRRLERQYTAQAMAAKAEREGLGGPEAARLTKPERERIFARANQQVEDEVARDNPPKTWDAGKEVLIDYLEKNRLPKGEYYKLHLDAGHTPPSEGFIINRQGQVAAQAVGYGDDHYLPFDLKNLKALKGGEYIRTRSIGGPTTEDIYTARVMGARSLTVVSRSGRFHVDFEDDFRGGRRHNEKAQRMSGRYEKLLDSVQSETLDKDRLPEEIETQIRADVDKLTSLTPKERRSEYKRRVKEFRDDPDFDVEDLPEYQSALKSNLAGAHSDDEREAIRSKMHNSWSDAMELRYRLNGPGYAAALKALQEQFPYYIKRTDYVPRGKEAERFSGEKDQGYVEPGHNRPTQAAEGYHGVLRGRFKNPAGEKDSDGNYRSGKFSASEADFQPVNAKYGTRDGIRVRTSGPKTETPADRNTGDTSPDSSTADAADGKAAEKKPGSGSPIENALSRGKEQEAVAITASNVIGNFQKNTEILGDSEGAKEMRRKYPFMGITDHNERVQHFLQHPGDVRTLRDMMDTIPLDPQTRRPMGEARKKALDADVLAAFDKATGKTDRRPYDSNSMRFLRRNQPAGFKGDEFEPDAPDQVVNDALHKRSIEFRPLSNPHTTLADMSDAELDTEIDHLDRMHRLLSDVERKNPGWLTRGEKDNPPGISNAEKQQAVAAISPTAAGVAGMSRLVNINEVEKQADAVQEVRALNLHKSRQNRGVSKLPARIEETPPDPKAPSQQDLRNRIASRIVVLSQVADALQGDPNPTKAEVSDRLATMHGTLSDMLKRPVMYHLEGSTALANTDAAAQLAQDYLNGSADEETMRHFLDNNK